MYRGFGRVDRRLVKQLAKQAVRRTIGEPYVGKRLKLRRVAPAMRRLGLDPRTILDAGAEDATFVYWLADAYPKAHVSAVDIDEQAMAACTAARPAKYADRVDFRVGYFADLEPSSFDVVTAFDVLEHIDDDSAAVADLYQALRPGGWLLVHVPRNQWTHADGRVEVVAPEDAWQINPGHVRMGYSPEGLRALIAGAGFDVVDEDIWLRRQAVRAHAAYTRLEHPAALRLLSLPVTDVLSVLDRRRPAAEGNSVWLVARRPD
jgi:SAM-dependent methyltransferase